MGSRVVVVCPVHGQLDHYRREMEAIWRRSRLPALFPSWSLFKDSLETDQPSVALTLHSAETGGPLLEGVHGAAVVLIVDEAKSVGDDVRVSLEPMLIGEDARFIAASTAGRGLNWFDRAFSNQRDQWDALISIGVEQCPRLAEKQRQMARLLGEHDPLYRAFYLNEPGGGLDGEPWFSLDKLTSAIARPIEVSDNVPTIWAVDPARFGRDSTVVARRRGGQIAPLVAWKKFDLMQSCGRIIEMLREAEHKPSAIVCDATGVGGGLADRLREELEFRQLSRFVRVRDFISGARASKQEEFFANEKSYRAHLFGSMLARGECSIPDDPALVAELASYERTVTSNGKAKIKDPSNRSPDRADAVLMTLGDEMAAPSIATCRPDWLGY